MFPFLFIRSSNCFYIEFLICFLYYYIHYCPFFCIWQELFKCIDEQGSSESISPVYDTDFNSACFFLNLYIFFLYCPDSLYSLPVPGHMKLATFSSKATVFSSLPIFFGSYSVLYSDPMIFFCISDVFLFILLFSISFSRLLYYINNTNHPPSQ